MLKKSVYNIDINKSDCEKLLLYNSLTGSFGLVHDNIKNLYLNSELIDETKVDNDDIKTQLKIMVDNGFLVSEEKDEKLIRSTMNKINRYSNNGLSLTIAPTLDCNMACPYCYEEKSNKYVMNEDTQRELVNFVEKQMKGSRFFSVAWYGGEPLLEIEIIRKLSKEFIRICNNNNVYYNAYIITNGVLLDSKVAKILKEECNVSGAQITVDGLMNTHNKRRILKNGEDSFYVIMKNIDDCQNSLKVNIRVNIDKNNIVEAKKLIDYFILEKKWNENVSFYFSPVTSTTESCNYITSHCLTQDEFGYEYSELLKYTYDIGKSVGRKILSRPSLSYGACGYISPNSYVVDPRGYLYKCWNIIGIEKHIVGDIRKGIVLNEEHLKWLNYEIPDKCNECKLVNLCNGACPYDAMYNNRRNCHFRTITYKTELELIYDNYMQKTI